MFKMPTGSKRSRRSDLIKTPKEARTPRALGWESFSSRTVSRSARVWAAKRISKVSDRIERVASARGPLPKKMREGLVVIGEESLVSGNLGVVVNGVEVALVIHLKPGGFIVANMVDEEETVEVVDFVEESAGESAGGANADFGAVEKAGLYPSLRRAGNKTVVERNGETTFVVGQSLALGFYYFRINQSSESRLGLVFHVITDDDNADVVTHLGGGHGGGEFVRVGVLPVEGKANHLIDDFLRRFVGGRDFLRLPTQTWVGSGDNLGHIYYYSTKGEKTQEEKSSPFRELLVIHC